MESWYELPSVELAHSLSGNAQVYVGSGMVVPSHFTEWVRSRVDSAAFRVAAGAAGGTRIRLWTSAHRIRLRVSLERFAYGDEVPSAVFFAACGGAEWVPVSADPAVGVFWSADADDLISERYGPDAEIELVRPSGADSEAVDICLPPNASVSLRRVEADAPIAARREPRSVRWLHHGSSISQGGHLVDPRKSWPDLAAERLGVEMLNASLPGNSLLDPCVGEELAGVEADIVSLELGINVVNWDSHIERTFVPALHGFLDHFTRGNPARRLVLISPFSCTMFENQGGPIELDEAGLFGPSPSPRPAALTLEKVRELMHSVVISRAPGSIVFVDGRSLFGPADEGTLEDRLHPNTEGTRLIAERFVAAVQEPGSALGTLFAGAGPR